MRFECASACTTARCHAHDAIREPMQQPVRQHKMPRASAAWHVLCPKQRDSRDPKTSWNANLHSSTGCAQRSPHGSPAKAVKLRFPNGASAKELLQRITRALQLVVRFAEAEADERARRVGGDVEGAHLCHTWCQL